MNFNVLLNKYLIAKNKTNKKWSGWLLGKYIKCTNTSKFQWQASDSDFFLFFSLAKKLTPFCTLRMGYFGQMEFRYQGEMEFRMVRIAPIQMRRKEHFCLQLEFQMDK